MNRALSTLVVSLSCIGLLAGCGSVDCVSVPPKLIETIKSSQSNQFITFGDKYGGTPTKIANQDGYVIAIELTTDFDGQQHPGVWRVGARGDMPTVVFSANAMAEEATSWPRDPRGEGDDERLVSKVEACL